MKKCIWYISKYVATPDEGGAGGRGYLLMREFARLGYRAVIITSDSNHLIKVPQLKKPYVHQDSDSIDLWWVRTFKYQVAKSFGRIISWLDFEWRLFWMQKEVLAQPDIIVVSSLSPLTILNGFRLKKKYCCRLVFEIRDIWPLTITEEGGFSPVNPFVMALGWVERLGYKHADAIVGTMPNLGEHVANILGYTKPVACIPMGVDLSMLDEVMEVPEEYAARYLKGGKFVVVHAGTIGITNALDVFLDCAKSLSENPDIHFLVVGDGDLRDHYQATYGYLKNLTFAPKVPKQMVQSVLARCDLLYFSVHVSDVWKFGQSLNKVIDYMLAGKPIVASYTGYPSMINEAGCGTFVPAGDMESLREEVLRFSTLAKSERDRMGACGREWVIKNRNYEVLARDYLAILIPEAPLEKGAN
jgi:glycosyltransferase involved in cell wall biosynthesis